MGLLVFMNRAEVIRKSRIPKSLQEELMSAMPVATVQKGKPVYLESQVDAFLRERFGEPKPMPYEKVQGARPRGGRKVTTEQEAIFALELKRQGKSLKEIVSAMKAQWPARKDCLNPESVRKTMTRHEKRRAGYCGLIR
jgi:hypothetical protein